MALTGKRKPALGTCEHAATIPQHKVTSGYRLFRSDRRHGAAAGLADAVSIAN